MQTASPPLPSTEDAADRAVLRDGSVVQLRLAGPSDGEAIARTLVRRHRLAEHAAAPARLGLAISGTWGRGTGILTGLALDIPPGRVRQLAGVLLNASYTVLRQRGEHLQLFQFNAVPHLTTPELRTHR